MTLTVLQNSGILERLEEMAAQEEHSGAHVTGPGFPPPWGQDIIDAHLARAKTIREAIALLKASREALDVFASAAAIMHRYRPDAPDDDVFRSGVAWTKGGEARTILMGDFRRVADVHARIGKA